MRVLVAVASRHGSTAEIAEQIASALRAMHLAVDVREAESVRNLAPYGAAVLGSAVDMGRWPAAAYTFIERLRPELEKVPVWVFSSGPLGEPPVPDEVPAGHREAIALLKPRGARVFAGRLDPRLLRFHERLVALAVHAPAVDFRDWSAVTTWASEIGAELRQAPAFRHGATGTLGATAEERLL